MEICAICQCQVEYVYNMFAERIGHPSAQLSAVITKCTRGTKRKYIRGGICQICFDDLSTFYESLQTAKTIRRKIMAQIERIDDCELDSSAKCARVPNTIDNIDKDELPTTHDDEQMNDEIYEESQSSNCNAEDDDNMLEETIQEIYNDEPVLENDEKDYVQELLTSVDENGKETEVDTDLDTEDEGEEVGPTCDECGENFSDYRSCKLHKAKVHPKKYICQHCGKVLATPTGLNKHVRLHDPDKPLACQICGKRYHFAVDLRNHEDSHTGERPYECHVCGKSFANYGSLSCHKIQHKPMPEGIECNVCGKKFRKPSRLKAHMFTHATEKNHKCPYCTYCTANKRALDFHLKKNKKCSVLFQFDSIESVSTSCEGFYQINI